MLNLNYSPDLFRQALEPGLLKFEIGRERYVVQGDSMVVIPLTVGDQIEIVDPEGLQAANVVAFNENGTILHRTVLTKSDDQWQTVSKNVGKE